MFDKLSNTLRARFGRKDELSRQLQIVKVFDIYKEEVKKLFADSDQIKPISFRNKTLTIQTTSAAMANELRFKEAEIFKKINAELKGVVVKRATYRF